MYYEDLQDNIDDFVQKYNSIETEYQDFTPDGTIADAINESKSTKLYIAE